MQREPSKREQSNLRFAWRVATHA